MELRICEAGEWRPACLGGGLGEGVHCDVLRGREAECGWEDVFLGMFLICWCFFGGGERVEGMVFRVGRREVEEVCLRGWFG